jgi:hypothetical protein
MAIIKYSDGTRINFNGTPTQQDVEEAYAKAKGLPVGRQQMSAPVTPSSPQTSSPIVPKAPEIGTVNGDQYDKKAYGILPKVADFLGISKFGTAIGRTINNMTGSADSDFKSLFDSLKTSDDQAIKVLHDPTATPDKIAQAKTILKSNSQNRQKAVDDYSNVGTAGLSNEQVIGSALNTAGALTLGGSLGGGTTGVMGAASKVAPTLTRAATTGAVYGATSGVGNAMQQDKSLQDVAGAGALGGVIGGGLGAAAYGISKLVEKLGDKIMKTTIKPSKADIADGFTLENVKKHNLGGSLSQTYEKTESKMNELTTQLNEKLTPKIEIAGKSYTIDTLHNAFDVNKLKGLPLNVQQQVADFDNFYSGKAMLAKLMAQPVPDTEAINALRGNLAELSDRMPNTLNLQKVYQSTVNALGGSKLKTFGANTSMQNALEQLQGEITNVGDILTVPEGQLVKQASGRMGAWQFGSTDPLATAREKVYNAFYTQLKTAIEKASPEGVQGLNKQLSELIPIANAVIRRIPVAERNNALGLSDMITLTAGMLNPHALATFGISMAQKSGMAGNALSKTGAKMVSKTPLISKVAGLVSGKISGQ